MELYRFTRGETPLLLSIPHAGTYLPGLIAARLAEPARLLPDTDWHVERLYDFAAELGANVLQATHSRYLIDLNRPPSGESLYPGQPTTDLCPRTAFDGTWLYEPGGEPDEAEIASRREAYWDPYHQRLRAELDRLRTEHGLALLYDAHSIRSHVPRLFDGRLPDLNLGTAAGASCASELEARLAAVLSSAERYSSVVNGRFIGGYITRAYGDPASGIHALQMELSQAAYMDEDPPFRYAERRAERLRPVLRRVLEAMLGWAERSRW